MEWNQTYGGVYYSHAYSVIQTGDKGFALAGWTSEEVEGHSDFWLIKTDSAGNVQWNQTYGGSGGEEASVVLQTCDGGYALAGWTNSFGAGSNDFWLVKTNSTGHMEWNQTYGGPDDDGVSSVIQTSGGGFALAGYTGSFGAGGSDFWLVETGSNGTHLWNATYGGGGYDIGTSIVQVDDGGYALVGHTDSFGAGGSDLWLIRTDSGGNMDWNRTYGGVLGDAGTSVVQTSDGGFAMAGRTESFGAGGTDYWLVRTDAAGGMLWSGAYGGAGDEFAVSMILTEEGRYALVGETDSSGAGGGDFWLVKTGSEAGLAWTDTTSGMITLYRGKTDIYWNYVRVRIWRVKETP
jgi:hypothetical protein